jgi:GntR family transcriptional regulator
MTDDAIQIDPQDPTPIYAQLDRAIRFAILTGRLQPGDRLPTVRQLAVSLRVNANTVAKVYSELERVGVVETRRSAGTFVSSRASDTERSRDREREFRALTDRFLAEAAALGFSPDEVIAYLRNGR